MTQVNWSLLGGNNALANFQLGSQMVGQAMDARDAREYRNDLLQMRQREHEAEVAQRQAEAAEKAQKQRRADLPLLINLLDHAKDEQTFQQSRAAAKQYGVDLSNIPESYGDGSWVEQQKQTLRMLQTPQGQEALSTAGKIAADMGFKPGTPEYNAKVSEIWQAESTKFLATQPGGGVASIAPGGSAQFVIQPNPGTQPAGAPVQGGVARPQSEAEYNALPPGAQYYAPDGSVRTKGGGGAPRVTSNFLDGL